MRPGRPPVPAEWIRDESDRLAIEEGCWFDESAGMRVVAFIERFCIQSVGEFAGKPLVLIEWEYDLTMRLFGWKRPDKRRRFNSVYVEIGKKNGKSTFLAALEIVLVLIDGEASPQVYINACDRGQASIIFDESARMVQASAELSRRLRIVDYKKRIVCPSNHGSIRANSADAPNKDGFNPSAVLWDELHRQPDYALWEVFLYSMSARRQPLRIAITTAGEDDTGVWFEQREYSERVAKGIIPDTTHLGIVYRCDPADDLDDPEVWRKANPALGITIDEATFAREWKTAKANPRLRAAFLRLRFNILGKSDSTLIPVEEWDACHDPLDLTECADLIATGGFDLASKIDLAAFVALIRRPDGRLHCLPRFYLPEDRAKLGEQTDRVPYGLWAKQGWLTLTPGGATDYEYIRHDINRMAGREWHEPDHAYRSDDDAPFRLAFEEIAGDEWNAAQFATTLRDQDGFRVTFITQGFRSLSPPTKELEKLVTIRGITHDGNPLMRWCIANAVAVEDAQKNLKLDKKKSRLKIDGAAALVNALAPITTVTSEDTPTHDANDIFYV